MTTTTETQNYNHYSITDRVIFKGFKQNTQGTFFASISLPAGSEGGKQAFLNVSAVVSNAPAIQNLAKSLCDIPINDGKGTAAFVKLTNMKASNSFDDEGSVRTNDEGIPYINYNAFLNEIAFS